MAKLDRRGLLQAGLAGGLLTASGAKSYEKRKIPVILHTDIGGDVDDTYALLYLLRRPELDLKLVVTEGSNAVYRGRLAARLLTLAQRSDIPIALGSDGRNDKGAQSAWIGDFDLSAYHGQVRIDSAQAMVDQIMTSETQVTVISLGPATTVASALRLEPRIAANARFVGMFGALRSGYSATKPAEPEYNVKSDAAALRLVFAARWSCSITPLDTCGRLVLDGGEYQRLRKSQDPFAQACLQNSQAWLPNAPWMAKDFDLSKQSSTLFDVVAVAMAFDESDLVMETLPLSVLEDGMTIIDPINGTSVRCATAWKNMARFKARLVASLTQERG